MCRLLWCMAIVETSSPCIYKLYLFLMFDNSDMLHIEQRSNPSLKNMIRYLFYQFESLE